MEVVRENTEGLYVGLARQFKCGTPDDVSIQREDVNTRKGVDRVIRCAFDYARSHKLGRVPMSDKSNTMTYGHEFWQRVFAEVSSESGDIEARHLYIDTLTMELICDPSQFRVIVSCNLFGEVLRDLAAQLEGEPGLAPSENIPPRKNVVV